MPIITFFRNIFATTKGPYYRRVGRHTQNFCKRAVNRTQNEIQKKIFFVPAICADELIASLIGVDNKRQVEAFKGRTLQDALSGKQIAAALRIYLSAILVLTSSQKKLILKEMGLNEQDLLQAWCSIFEYTPSDMQLFNETLLSSYRTQGLEGLARTVGEAIREQLFAAHDELSPAELETLQNIMVEDASAVLRVLTVKGAETCDSH